MKTLYCDLIKGNNQGRCGAKVLLIDTRMSTVFPHAHPNLFKAGLSIAKHCPKCRFITGYVHPSVLSDSD